MWLHTRPSAQCRDEILTELGLPLNFFMPIAGTEFNGDFPEDLNETFKAVTYSSDEFNIEWFFERGNQHTYYHHIIILYELKFQKTYLRRKQGQQNSTAPRGLHDVQWEMRHLVCERGSQGARLLRQDLLGTAGKRNAPDIFEYSRDNNAGRARLRDSPLDACVIHAT